MVKQFQKMGLALPLVQALEDAGYQDPTPIQKEAIPLLLKGKDLLGIAKTGTGKTAAFSLPILNHLYTQKTKYRGGRPKVLILTPTRELAAQIHENLLKYGKHIKLKTSLIFGGVNIKSQVRSMEKGVDLCVATPGRLLELMFHGQVVLDQVEIFVLDEADRMLDMGFLKDVRKIIKDLPKKRQTLLFSATMPKDIALLSKTILSDAKRVEITPESTPVEKIEQTLFMVDRFNKIHLLQFLIKKHQIQKSLIFVKTKRGADRLVKVMARFNTEARAIHGDKSQAAREKSLKAFKEDSVRFLVATDLASRGIDVKGISHVINYNLPLDAEAYIHRIGRTARANTEGAAFSFCDTLELPCLKAVEKLIKMKIKITHDHPYPLGESPQKNLLPAKKQAPRNHKKKVSKKTVKAKRAP